MHRGRAMPSAGAGLEIFTAAYGLVGIGILVELARRLGMAFIAARAEVEAKKHAENA
jgi:hypothetical protein